MIVNAQKMIGTLGKYDPTTRSVAVLAATTNAVEGEAVTAWDFSRFEKNPVVLWNHEAQKLPVGTASNVTFMPEADPPGLRMIVTFASEGANPLGEQLAKCVQEGLVRAVSVGFDYEGGVGTLIELSFVTIGADEDAGTGAMDPDAKINEDVIAARVKYAARQLGLHRARAAKARDAARQLGKCEDEQRTDAIEAFASSLEKARLDAESPPLAVKASRASGKANGMSKEAKTPADHAAAARAHRSAARAHRAAGNEARAKTHDAAAERHIGAGKVDAATVRSWDDDDCDCDDDDEDCWDDCEDDWDSWKKKKGPKRRKCKAHGTVRAVRLDAADSLRRMGGRLGKAVRTSLGGARVPARLGRTGVLTYRNEDGTLRRELRLESEVFREDSIATLEHVPVIDIKDHTALVTPETYRKVSLGHVSKPAREGKFLNGELIVQDKDTLDAIDRGDRTEISLGYKCRLEWTSGTFEGQEYDCIQRNIRYNHAALCPPNRGRAGPEVGLRLDNNEWGESHLEDQENLDMEFVVIDGVKYALGSAEHMAKLDAMNKAALDKARFDAKEAQDKAVAEIQVRLDKAEAERDDFKAQLEKVNLDAKKSKEEDDKKKEEEEKTQSARKRFRRTLERLYAAFKRAFGKEGMDEKDEEKMDAMSDRELMLECIRMDSPDFDAKDKSDDYVHARFDSIAERVKKTAPNPRGPDSIVRSAQTGYDQLRTDANDASVSDMEKARKERDARMNAAWKAPPVAGGK